MSMERPASDAIRNVGFNESVHLDSRTLHVQTEVLMRQELLVQTTVLEGGRVRFSCRTVCPEDISGLESVRAFVEAQHKSHVQIVILGEAPWLAST
jgi:hypothetical protein